MPKSQSQKDDCDTDKIGLVGFECRQIADPGTADPERDEHKRHDATGGGQQRAEYASHRPKLVAFLLCLIVHENQYSLCSNYRFKRKIERVMPEQMIKRGELGKATGCNIETIRYYEKIGLLLEPDRSAGGHRLYSKEDRARLGFILRSRDLGFSIEELKSLLSLVDSHGYSCGEVLELTRDHLTSVRQKIADLKKLERTLAGVSAQCEGGDVPECPIIDALFGHEVGFL